MLTPSPVARADGGAKASADEGGDQLDCLLTLRGREGMLGCETTIRDQNGGAGAGAQIDTQAAVATRDPIAYPSPWSQMTTATSAAAGIRTQSAGTEAPGADSMFASAGRATVSLNASMSARWSTKARGEERSCCHMALMIASYLLSA
jgi:hypothetical protein